MTKKELLEYVEEFIKKHNFSATGFGSKVLNDPMFVFHLRKGREAREETQNKVITFIQKYEEK